MNCGVSNLSEVDKRILKRQLNADSKVLSMQFSSLLEETQSELTKIECTRDKLLTCIMSMDYIRDVLKDPLLSDLESAETTDRIIYVLTKRKLVSFLHYELIEIIITSCCKNSINLNEELKQYKEKFDDYIKRRVYETPLYYDGQLKPFTGSSDSEETIDLLIITDNRWNHFTQYVNITELEDIIANAFRCNRILLTLRSIEPHCLKLRYVLIPSLVDHIFPLTLEECNKLRSHGVAEIHCRDYHYMVDEKGKLHMIHVLCDVALTVMHSHIAAATEKGFVNVFIDQQYSSKGM